MVYLSSRSSSIITNKETNMSILKRPPEKSQDLPKDDSEQKES